MKKHILKLDESSKALGKNMSVYNCQNCPTGVEAYTPEEAYQILSWSCLQNMMNKSELKKGTIGDVLCPRDNQLSAWTFVDETDYILCVCDWKYYPARDEWVEPQPNIDQCKCACHSPRIDAVICIVIEQTSCIHCQPQQKGTRSTETWREEFRKLSYDGPVMEHFVSNLIDQVREETNKEWESRGIITECHNCDKVVHIFPEDASRLMKEYYGGLEKK